MDHLSLHQVVGKTVTIINKHPTLFRHIILDLLFQLFIDISDAHL